MAWPGMAALPTKAAAPGSVVFNHYLDANLVDSFAENQLGCLNSIFDSASCRQASAGGTRSKKQKLARSMIAAWPYKNAAVKSPLKRAFFYVGWTASPLRRMFTRPECRPRVQAADKRREDASAP
jgi:hypothetical protein